MIEKIARRAGGFASTTALRWLGAGAEALPETPLTPESGGSGTGRKGLAAAAVTGAAALLTSHTVRAGLETGLRAVSKAIRPEPPARSSRKSTSNGNGNGNGSLTDKTRAELYELAKKMELPGRSGMSKEELAKALSR